MEESASPPSFFQYRNWNSNDFVGKYHRSRLAEKNAPIPGTQLQIELSHEVQRSLAYKKIEDDNNLAAENLQKLLKIKAKGIEFKTRVDFDNSVYLLISDAQNVIQERQSINEAKNISLDDMKTINKFMSNIELGRHNFVGYSISSGYKSINYQLPDSGNTALHIAARKGHVETVEELLKYKADPDVKNKLGFFPIHEAWMFWKKKHDGEKYRTREEREKQEEDTTTIVKHILSYKGYVDAQDIDGNTALHVACRLGPTRLVKLLLGFKADFMMRNKAGLLPIDVASHYHKEEARRLLQSWGQIRQQLIHVDFSLVWQKFLKDSEAVISTSKTAEAIISEVEMEGNLRKLERDGKNSLAIDDAQLRQIYYDNRAYALSEKAPLPWEEGWQAYVEEIQGREAAELKNKMNQLELQLKKTNANVSSTENSDAVTAPDKAVINAQQHHHQHHHSKPSASDSNPFANRLNVVHMTKEERRSWAGHKPRNTTASGRLAPDRSFNLTTENEKKEDFLQNHIKMSENEDDEEEEEKEEDKISNLTRRRLQAAKNVAIDAKFLKFTTRLSTNSALLLPLRTPQAPLVETEEEHSQLRAIAAQGKEFDKFEKYKIIDKKADLIGLSKKPPVNVMGAYCKPLEIKEPNARDKLFDSVATLVSSSAADSTPSSGDNQDIANKYEPNKKDKIELVAGASRPRYVQTDILPPKHVVSAMEQMFKDKLERDKANYFLKQGLAGGDSVDAARAQMEAMIAAGVDGEQALTDSNSISGIGDFISRDSKDKEKAAKEKELAIAKRLLDKPEVKYGLNRLTSTHNSKGKLEEPWTTVGGRYATLLGDRTA